MPPSLRPKAARQHAEPTTAPSKRRELSRGSEARMLRNPPSGQEIERPQRAKRQKARSDHKVTVALDQCSKVVQNPESWAVERTDAEVWLLLSEGKCYTAPKAVAAAQARQLKWPHEVQCGLRMASRGTQAADTCSFDATSRGGMVVGTALDNARGEVALLWQMLQQVRSGIDNHVGTTRRGAPLPSTRHRGGTTATTKGATTSSSSSSSSSSSAQQTLPGRSSNRRGHSSNNPEESTPPPPPAAADTAVAETPMFQRTFSKQASARRKKDDYMVSAVYIWQCHLRARAFGAWQRQHRQQKLSQQMGAEEAVIEKGKAQGTQVGLRNLGNTCYVNSVLQALVSVPAFRAAFALDQHDTQRHEKDGLTCDPGNANGGSAQNANLPLSPPESPTVLPELAMVGRRRRGGGGGLEGGLRGDNIAMSSSHGNNVVTTSSGGAADTTAATSAAANSEDSGGGGARVASTLSLATEFRRLCRVVLANKLVRHTPDRIISMVWKLFGSFRGFRQHDAAEILVHLIDRLEVEETACVSPLFSGKLVQQIEYTRPVLGGRRKDNKASSSGGGGNRAKRSRTAAAAAADDKEEEKEEVEKEESVVSSTEMPFCGPWTIDIPPQYRVVGRPKNGTPSSACTLAQCLEEATSPEQLVGDSQYRLDDGSLVDAQKRVLLAQPAPQVLVLHINRTAWHASGVHKVQTHVSFPLKLDNLEQYCAAAAPEPSPASSPGGPSLKAPSKRKQEAEEAKEEAMAYSSSSSSSSSLLEYQLVSVVCHHGHQMGGGHFTAYGRSAVGNPGAWWHFNDARVTKASLEEVTNAQAYILMYARV